MGRIIKKHELHSAKLARHPLTERALSELLDAHACALRLRRETRAQVIDLAFTIAQKFTAHRLERSDTLLCDLYHEALLQLPDGSSGVIAIAPEDRTRSSIEQLTAPMDLRVEDDPALSPGECRVTIDGQLSIEATFGALRRALEPLLEELET